MCWCFVYSLLHFFGNWLVSIHRFFGLAGGNTSTGWLATASTSVVFNYDWMGGASRSAATVACPQQLQCTTGATTFAAHGHGFGSSSGSFFTIFAFFITVTSWFLVTLNLSNMTVLASFLQSSGHFDALATAKSANTTTNDNFIFILFVIFCSRRWQ